MQLKRDVIKVINYFNSYDGGVFESDFGLHFFQINGYYMERAFVFGLSFRPKMKLLKQFYDEFTIDTDSRAHIDGQWIFHSKNKKQTINDKKSTAPDLPIKTNIHPQLTKSQHVHVQPQIRSRPPSQEQPPSKHENSDATILRYQLSHDIIKVLKVYNGIIEQDFPLCLNKYYENRLFDITNIHDNNHVETILIVVLTITLIRMVLSFIQIHTLLQD